MKIDITGKFFVTGEKGNLGSSFIRQLYKTQAIVIPSEKLDITNRNEVLNKKKIKPDCIIHCGAKTDADLCETQKKMCYDINVRGVRNIVELAEITGAKLVYPQSFLIYDGKEIITENTNPNPLSYYGECKLEAEKIITTYLPSSLIICMGGFFGGYEKDKNFIGFFTRHIAQQIKYGNKNQDVGDRTWQPTYTQDLVSNTLALLSADKEGKYCMASHGEASFYDIACVILDVFGIDSNTMKINKVPSQSINYKNKAKRPDRAYIENQRLKLEGLDFQQCWKESLVQYLNNDYFRRLFNE
jgi:dTDP-4-dehydrorhamnose reductase